MRRNCVHLLSIARREDRAERSWLAGWCGGVGHHINTPLTEQDGWLAVREDERMRRWEMDRPA